MIAVTKWDRGTRRARAVLPVLLAGVLLAAATAGAAPSFTWPGAPAYSVTVNDPDEGLAKTAQEILSAAYAWDGTHHYFRITLKAAPSGVGPTDNFAGNYGIYIQKDANPAEGWSFNDTNYLPYNIQGLTVADVSSIDIALDGHWNYGGGGASFPAIGQHNHVATATPGAFSYETLDGFNPQVGSSNVIEFKLGTAFLPAGAGFTWFAGTLDNGSEIGTYDLTAPTHVPEPMTLGLLGLGGVALLRRRGR